MKSLLVSAFCILLLSAPLAAAETISEAPLQPQAPASGETHFTLLAPEQTGIHFVNAYDDPSMWGRRYREFTLGAVGAGVATGDFDQDGWPDIYAVSKTGPNRLYRQVAPLQFEDVTDAAGVAGLPDSWATGATFVDVDNDGWLDLYVCQFDAPNQLYINQGDGTFKEEAASWGIDVIDASVMAAFADADRDGDLDLYLQTNILDYNQNFKGRPDYFFINNGDGSFTDQTAEAGIWGITQGHSATWWDYNQDDWPDIYVANDFENSDRLYRNNGDGTFTDVLSETIPHTSYFSMGSDLGDVNNDGLTDFFVGDMAATSHEKDKRGMAEMGRGIWENERVDSLFPMYMRNAFYLNNGTERFNEIAYLNRLDASDWTWAVKFADLDNDGWTDLFITNGNIRNFMEADLLDKQNVASSMVARIRVYKNAPVFEERNLAFRNQGDLRFENVSKNWGLDHLGVSFGASYVDLDRDGDLDIVVNNLEDNLHLYRNDSQRPGFLVRLQGVSSNRYGIGASAYYQSPTGTQTRQLVLARGVLSNDEPLLHFAPGRTSEQAGKLEIRWPSGHRSTLPNPQPGILYTITEPSGPATRLPALDASRKPASQFTEVSKELGLNYTHQEDYHNELTAQLLLPRRLSKQGPALALATHQGIDGELLLVSGAKGSTNTAYRFKDGAFTALPEGQFASASEAETLGLFIGPQTVYAAHGAVGPHFQDSILTAPTASDSPVSSATSCVAAGDFDGDGDLDLFVGARSIPGAYPETPRSYLLANQDGHYVDVTETHAPELARVGLVSSALWSDANGDGHADLLLALEWAPLTLFANQSGQLVNQTQEAGFAPYLGWWNSVVAADFNADGRMDYAVGNAGLNTKYLATPERPTYLYYGDFDGRGKKHILEAQYEDGDEKLYPIRPFSKLRYAFPALGQKFESFAQFSQATLTEIFPAETLENALRLEANTLASGVFLSQGNGKFAFQELPRIAQIAPVFGMVAQDFNGDGFTDLFLAQNSFSPEPTTGRFNGGLSLLLLGDGQGSFEPSLSSESGLMVRGDAKAALSLDLDDDGWADLLVSQNSEKLLAFRNRGYEDNHSFALTLAYHAENPQAYGARVKVLREDGSFSHSELSSANGYLTQSQAKLFFGYTQQNKPVEIQVTWPQGETSSHPYQGEKQLKLTYPAP